MSVSHVLIISTAWLMSLDACTCANERPHSLVSTALSIWMSNWMGMAFTGIFPEMATDAAEYETEVTNPLLGFWSFIF